MAKTRWHIRPVAAGWPLGRALFPFAVAPLVMFTASRAKMGEPIVPSWLIARSIILLSSVLLGWSVTIL